MKILITEIKGLMRCGEKHPSFLKGKEMSDPGLISSAWLIIDEGLIQDYGKMEDLRSSEGFDRIINASGKFVIPSFCDPHTHLVYAGSREQEFVDRIEGLSYEEIAKRGGGILNSAALLHKTSEEELFRQSMKRIDEIISSGTGAVEIKSGYGLNTEEELKMLRVINRIRKSSQLEVRSTFLGAHAIPAEYKNNRSAYIDLIINEMMPEVAAGDLADFVDVFCDKGFFTTEETERILMAGLKYGLRAKIHANELAVSGGVQTGIKYEALSVDHLERVGDEEIIALQGTDTMPTLLPGSSFFIGLPDPPARKMIDSGLPIALASDYNPGSSPSGNMKLVMSLACIRLRLTPAEALNAATINSAYAMGISESYGSISKGKIASLFITMELPSFEYFPYSFGENLIDTVILRGRVWKEDES